MGHKTACQLAFLAASLLQWSADASADTTPIEEIIVTGSFIEGTPEDAALPVDVLRREDLQAIGDPTLIELTRNLSYTSGNVGERDPTRSGPLFANFNLRGMGTNRTRLLLNGHRYPIDINTLPRTAIERIEVLKDGAAVLYGSDAMAGVVNFITRRDFQGLELAGSVQHIDNSQGNYSLAGIVGQTSERSAWSVAAEWDHRSVLEANDREWALRPWTDNPEGGWSFIGNPGSYIPAIAPNNAAIIGAPRPDPQCDLLGGTIVGPVCQFQFTYFYPLIEETDSAKIFGEFSFELSQSLTLYAEGLYSVVSIPDASNPPSFPPNVPVSPDRFVSPNHPGLVDLKAQNPNLFPDVGPFPGPSQGTFTLSRPVGVAGHYDNVRNDLLESRTGRLVLGLRGDLLDGSATFDLAAGYNEYRTHERLRDALIEEMAFALDGLGGASCDRSAGVPGTGPCSYYNPFSNAIDRSVVNGATNPQYNPEVANSSQLLNWLMPSISRETEFQSSFFDAVFSATTGLGLGGGPVGAAIGVQARRLEITSEVDDLLDRAINPCPFTDPFSVTRGYTDSLDCEAETGRFAFVTAANEAQAHQDIYAIFGEVSLPLTSSLDVQLAVRYEHYAGPTGDTVDPKLAFSWRPTGWLTFRGSASTTYSAPLPTWLVGSNTSIQFVNVAPDLPARATAVDVLGNPEMNPESALASNLGIVIQTANFYGSLDWWRYDVEDPFYQASGSQVMDAYVANDCPDGGSGADTQECGYLRSQVFPTGTQPIGLQRIAVQWTNGTYEITRGVDFFSQYDFYSVFGGTLSLGLEGTYTDSYRSGDFVQADGIKVGDGGEFAGYLNDATPFTPKPKLKGNAFGRYQRGTHTAGLYLRYVDDYRDARPSMPELSRIEKFVTIDLNYNVAFSEALNMTISVFNLLDEDPPSTSTNLNYDALTHNGFGRSVKLGLVYRHPG